MEDVEIYNDENMPSTELLEHANSLVTSFYQRASELKITDEEQKKLQQPVDSDLIEIRPDGLIYYPQVFARQQLNDTFGVGQWALVQHVITQIKNILCFDGSLYIRGCFVARAMGEHEYIESNRNTSWASVYESAKSDCLVRCCKDLGIGKELWQPKFSREWIQEHAIKVFVKVKNRETHQEETKVQWRRKDQEPYWNESGIVPTNGKTNQQPKNEKPNIPTPQKKVERNYTAEAEACGTLDDLKNWYTSLNKDEQKKYAALKNNVKETIQKNQPIDKTDPTKDVLLIMIKGLTVDNYDKNHSAIEKLMDEKPKENRDLYAKEYFAIVNKLKVHCSWEPIPF